MGNAALYNERKQYYNLKNNLNVVLKYLKEARQNVSDCNKVDLYYLIDDGCSLKEKFNSNVDALNEYIDSIEKNMIPFIDLKINSLNREISSLETID